MTTAGSCGTGITCRVLVSGQTLPTAVASAPGTFAVTLRNDVSTVNGDQALIGGTNATNPPDGTATLDNNKFVILKSTGTFNGANRTITAVIQRGNLLINAAVSLPGVQGDTDSQVPPCAISVGCYSVDGRDYRNTDTWSPDEHSHRSRPPEVRDDRGDERDRDHGPERVRQQGRERVSPRQGRR